MKSQRGNIIFCKDCKEEVNKKTLSKNKTLVLSTL